MELVISLDTEDMAKLQDGQPVFIKMNPEKNYDNFQMVVVKTDDTVYPIVEDYSCIREVTRCGNCGYYNHRGLACNRPNGLSIIRFPDDYCSEGIKKEEE